jgi:heme-degrading monooxygenase HmoA
MILRVFIVTVREGMIAEFEDFFRKIAIPQAKKWPGMLSMHTGKPDPEDQNQFCMTMIWKDLDALRGFAGENWREARIEPEEAHLIESVSLKHFELIAASGHVEL